MTEARADAEAPTSAAVTAEAARLDAVRRYDILDTPPDGAFDRVTALAARLFKVPIAIVSIVDTDRIWFKSHHGTEAGAIGRDPGLCASAILQHDPYLVTDARRDPRTMANPLVAGELGLRFYAAAPLTTHDGFNLGTLCVLDTSPREVTGEELQTLTDLAAVVVDELELRRSATALHEREEEILARTAQFARTLQQSLLPAEMPAIAGLDLAALFHSADEREVAGDFYDVFRIREGRWAVALGDVAGKGPGAAAATSLVRYSLRTAALGAEEPGAALAVVNRTMLASEHFGVAGRPGFCTLVLAYIDTDGPAPLVTVARAGHVRPILVTDPGQARELGADGPLLGVLDSVEFALETFELGADDTLVLFTDGLSEAREPGTAGGVIAHGTIAARLAEASSRPAGDVIAHISAFLDSLDVRDDVAAIALRTAR